MELGEPLEYDPVRGDTIEEDDPNKDEAPIIYDVNKDKTPIEVGQYILVEFTGACEMGAFYVGCVVAFNGENFRTRFLRRADLKKNREMKFRELAEDAEEERYAKHTKEQVRLLLPPPKQHKGTARTSNLLVFNDDRLEKFSKSIVNTCCCCYFINKCISMCQKSMKCQMGW